MKRLLFAIAIMMAIGIIPAFAADVGVSISIGQPGFYGRIDIGNAPQPEFVNPQPIIIQPVRIESILLDLNAKRITGSYR